MYRKLKDTLKIMPAFYDYLSVYALDDLWVDAHALSALKTLNFAEKPLSAEGDDYAGDTSTTGVIVVGGADVTGRLETVHDEDWFRFSVAEGEVISFATFFDQHPSHNYPYFGLKVYDSSGVRVAFEQTKIWRNDTYFLNFIAETSGNFYYVVTGEAISTYTTTAVSVADDYRNSNATSTHAPIGHTISGVLDYYGDSDWFIIEVEAGQHFRFDVYIGANTAVTVRPFVTILDQNGVELTTSGYLGQNHAIAMHLFEAAGTFYVSVSGFNYHNSAAYDLSIAEIIDDFSADVMTVGTLALDGLEAQGRIELQGDEDWFSVNLVAGETLHLDINGPISLRGYEVTLGFAIYDVNGDLAFQPRNYAFRNIYNFVAQTSGVYFVAISGRDIFDFDYTIDSEIVTDDYASTIETTGVLGYDVASSGTLEFSRDSDWFAVDIRGVDVLRITADWVDGASNERLYIYVRRENGEYVEGDFTGGPRSPVEFSIPEIYRQDEIFYIEIVASNSVDTGAYTLNAEVSVDLAGETVENAFSLAVGTTLSETLTLGDLDVYAIQVPLDGSVLIELTGTGVALAPGSSRFSGFNFFTPFGPGGIFSVPGESVQNVSLTRNSDGTVFLIYGQVDYLQLDPASDGLIYLLVGGPYYHLSQGDYTVSVSSFEDDHGGTVNTATAINLGEYHSGFIDANHDYDVFSVYLTEDQIVRFSVDTHANGRGGEYRISYMAPEGGIYGSDNTNVFGNLVDYGIEARYTGLHYFRVSTLHGASVDAHYEVLVEEVEYLLAPAQELSLGDIYEARAVMAAGFLGEGAPLVGFHTITETSTDRFAIILTSTVDDPYYRDLNISVAGIGFVATYSDYSFFGRQITVLDAGEYSMSFYGVGGTYDYTISLVEYFGGTNVAQNIVGSDEDSVIEGSDFSDTLNGAGGADFIAGYQGDDVLIGGFGDDVLEGGPGADVLNGGAGLDTAHYRSLRAITVNLSDPSQNSYFAAGDTYISIENIFGSDASGDILTGDGGNNIINGGRGADTLYGLGGDDHLIADRGVLFGGAGDDTLETKFGGTLYGGAGDDVLISTLSDASVIDGGSGIDVAVYGERSADFIRVVANIDGTYSVFRGLNFTREEVISNVEIIRVGGVDYNIDSLAEPEILQHDDFYGVVGADRFMIFADSVDDRIFGFEEGIDRIVFSGDMYRYSQLKIYQDGADVIIASSNGLTRLVDTSIANIDASDFIFRIGADDGDMENIDAESAENMPDAEIVLYDEFGIPNEIYEAIADMRSPEDVFYEYNEHGILEIITPDDAIL